MTHTRHNRRNFTITRAASGRWVTTAYRRGGFFSQAGAIYRDTDYDRARLRPGGGANA